MSLWESVHCRVEKIIFFSQWTRTGCMRTSFWFSHIMIWSCELSSNNTIQSITFLFPTKRKHKMRSFNSEAPNSSNNLTPFIHSCVHSFILLARLSERSTIPHAHKKPSAEKLKWTNDLHFWKQEDLESVEPGLEFICHSKMVKTKSISI